MFNLNKDVLYLIFEELQHNINSLYSCLLVNKTWSGIVIPILWRNPWKTLLKKVKDESLFNVIVSHLSNETKENLRLQGINLLMNSQKPSFNYISFCRYLKLDVLEEIIVFTSINKVDKSKISFIRSEILKLFISRNTRITHLYMPKHFNYPIHLILGAEHCFSELKYLYCKPGDNNQSILEGLSNFSKSIKRFECCADSDNNNSGLIKLIEAQKNPSNFRFCCSEIIDRKRKILEDSLIKHADTIRHLRIDWKPVTNIFSHLVNLTSLEISLLFNIDLCYLENVSLPVLEVLKAQGVPSRILEGLIENTKGCLTEISVDHEGVDNKRLIQTIYKKCSKLQYFKLLIDNNNISEFEKLLINCQNLDGLYIITRLGFDWDHLFELLTKSSPNGLFKFKLYFTTYTAFKLESLKLFFDNWKGRHPMMLQTGSYMTTKYLNLIEQYKAKGIIKKYDHSFVFEDFEWNLNI